MTDPRIVEAKRVYDEAVQAAEKARDSAYAEARKELGEACSKIWDERPFGYSYDTPKTGNHASETFVKFMKNTEDKFAKTGDVHQRNIDIGTSALVFVDEVRTWQCEPVALKFKPLYEKFKPHVEIYKKKAEAANQAYYADKTTYPALCKYHEAIARVIIEKNVYVDDDVY